jgi:hypothetical protein
VPAARKRASGEARNEGDAQQSTLSSDERLTGAIARLVKRYSF